MVNDDVSFEMKFMFKCGKLKRKDITKNYKANIMIIFLQKLYVDLKIYN